MSQITLELFGVLRQQAGRSEFEVEAGTVGEALAAVARADPHLGTLLLDEGGNLRAEHRLAVNGGVIATAADLRLRDQDRLVVLSAHAGG